MERHEIMDLMTELRLHGMRDAFDEVIGNGLKRKHPVQQIVTDLLKAEIAEKTARSIKYQMTIAKLPLAKELADFTFAKAPSSRTNAMPSSSAAPEPERAIWPSPSGATASAPASVDASITLSISSTALKPKPVPAVRAGSPISSPVSTSPSSMSSATCHSPNPAANSSST
jgi:hypothetical protein